MKRKVAIVTTTRAEYGILRRLIQLFEKDAAFELLLWVSGSHLDNASGMTVDEVEKDNVKIDERISIVSGDDTVAGMAKTMSTALEKFIGVIGRKRPEIMIVVGDRYEMLAVVEAAFLSNVPVAHIHGGEVTTHAIDDSIRHAITKFSQYHFTAAEAYRKRVIQLGEQPDRVFTVGAPGLDNIRDLKLLSAAEISTDLNWKISRATLLVTYHPETLRDDLASEGATLLESLTQALKLNPAMNILFTAPNLDVGGKKLLQGIEEFCSKNNNRTKLVKSLGVLRYLSVLQSCGAVVGNSSSGIIEAPFMRVPTVNIGKRQEGRLRAASVIDCELDAKAIVEAVERALAMHESEDLKSVSSLYGDARASEKIYSTLKSLAWPRTVAKRFFDMESAHV